MTTPIHNLKLDAQYFDDVLDGNKTAEVRRADRDFNVGDIVTLKKWDPKRGVYLDREGRPATPRKAHTLSFAITHILPGGQHGIEPNYCVLSLGGLP